MILDMLILRHLLEYQTQDLLEFLLRFRLHIASDVLCLLLQLPFEAGKLLSGFIDGKRDHIHVQMNGKLILLLFIASELERVVVAIFQKSNGGHLQSAYNDKYLMFLVVWMTSKSVPLVLNSLMRSDRSFS